MKSCSLVLLAAVCFGTTAAAQPPPVEAFAALPTTQSPSISPDGKRIAFIAQTGQGTFVYAAQLATNTADAIVGVGGGGAKTHCSEQNETAALHGAPKSQTRRRRGL